MIAAAAQTLDVRDWAVALPLLLVLVGFCAIGVWMIAYSDDARRFMDHSQEKTDAWFNRHESRPTPRSFPRMLGAVFVIFAGALAVVLVVSVTASG